MSEKTLHSGSLYCRDISKVDITPVSLLLSPCSWGLSLGKLHVTRRDSSSSSRDSGGDWDRRDWQRERRRERERTRVELTDTEREREYYSCNRVPPTPPRLGFALRGLSDETRSSLLMQGGTFNSLFDFGVKGLGEAPSAGCGMCWWILTSRYFFKKRNCNTSLYKLNA